MTDYAALVYRIGQRYSAARSAMPDVEYPYFTGRVCDLVVAEPCALPDLQGEYVVAYSDGQGTRHLIHVYFDNGAYEAEGMPPEPGVWGLQAGAGQG